jgi:Tfp pilus assembly protein PilX
MRSIPRRQEGSVLVVCLVMLVLVTLFGLSSVNSSVVNLKIIGNSQSLKSLESSTLQAIEQVIGSLASFQTPAAHTVTVNAYSITFTAPTCLASSPAEGYSALSAVSPEDTYWELQAAATDPVTGANVAMSQGVKIRLNAGLCP